MLDAIELEHKAAAVCAQIERNGFPFHTDRAAQLYAAIAAARQDVEQELKEVFGFWFEPDAPGGDASRALVDPSRTIRYKDPGKIDRVVGQPWTKVKVVHFNPNSRQHVVKRLKHIHGWEPEELTKGGEAKLDDEVLGKLDYPEAQKLAEYFMLQKRAGQIAEGDQAWLKLERDGFIFGSVNPMGTVTYRASHSWPNLGQVPGNKTPHGKECRDCFGITPDVRKRWPNAVMVGTDKSGLELRCLGHFMAIYDGGHYIEQLLGGDVHWMTVEAFEILTQGTARDKHNALHELLRDCAKTFIYGFLYGAGDLKVGRIILEYALKEETLGIGTAIRRHFFKGKRGVGEGVLRKVGKTLKANFLARLPALSKLIDGDRGVKKRAKRGFLRGLDGRRIPIRYDHAALNSLLQCAGAVLCKKWMVLLDEALRARGYVHGWNGDYVIVAWVHDELQLICKNKEMRDEVAELSAECAARAGEHFNFKCPLTADTSDCGETWKDTH